MVTLRGARREIRGFTGCARPLGARGRTAVPVRLAGSATDRVWQVAAQDDQRPGWRVNCARACGQRRRWRVEKRGDDERDEDGDGNAAAGVRAAWLCRTVMLHR